MILKKKRDSVNPYSRNVRRLMMTNGIGSDGLMNLSHYRLPFIKDGSFCDGTKEMMG